MVSKPESRETKPAQKFTTALSGCSAAICQDATQGTPKGDVMSRYVLQGSAQSVHCEWLHYSINKPISGVTTARTNRMRTTHWLWPTTAMGLEPTALPSGWH